MELESSVKAKNTLDKVRNAKKDFIQGFCNREQKPKLSLNSILQKYRVVGVCLIN